MDFQSQHNASKKYELGSSQQVSHPGSEICVHPKMLHVFRYRRAHVYDLHVQLHSTEQQGRLELLVFAVKIINEGR